MKLDVSGPELLAGRPKEGAVGREVFEKVRDLTAVIRWSQHDDALQPAWAVSGKIGAREKPAHRVGDEMKLANVFGETGDGGMDVFHQRLDWAFTAGVVEIERRITRSLQRPLHFAEQA